ncbi:hypothetical protein QAD02_006363 [Eretmocerus hayati]|uniref:Uncharacterized protein n=1 Tax=Eretmocerus hayati TaxID=131215 RepID=A0ACC2N110_9HYME|nr:hypothetical protein QAD02_006363 [Eretmocerus hayati]
MCASPVFVVLSFLLSIHQILSQYVPPEALVEPLKPAGIRISIPYDEGSTLVAFHVKFNEEFDGLEAGSIARDILKPKNGRWTYKDKTTKLNKGDKVYYWIHVVYNGLGYNLIDQEHTVNDFYDENGDVLCELSETKLYEQDGSVRNVCQKQLLFEEKFIDSREFMKNNWTIVEQFSTAPDYEFVVYRNSDPNIKVNRGLSIYPRLMKDDYGDLYVRKGTLNLKRCTSSKDDDCNRRAQSWNILPPVSSARINTGKAINFEYGHIEIRAKFPRGDWLYPLLMLEPVDNIKNRPESTTQIRIASTVGNTQLKTDDGRDISGFVLWGGSTFTQSDRFDKNLEVKKNDHLWSEEFHNYELTWSPGRLSMSVDGQLYADQQVRIPTDTPYYLTIGLAVGGLSEFPDRSMSNGYMKPWRNSEAKALLNFYNAFDSWAKTWDPQESSLQVSHVKISSL